MVLPRIAAFAGLVMLLGAVTPAIAGCDRVSSKCWWQAHHRIYRMDSRIVLLESDPGLDDGYKGPIVDRLHAKTLRLRAAIGPRWPHWPSSCCYSRRPIHIH